MRFHKESRNFKINKNLLSTILFRIKININVLSQNSSNPESGN